MLLGFRGEFESSLRNGIAQLQGLPICHKGAMVKRQTIRPWRGTLPPVGEPLFLWARLHHKNLPPIRLGEVALRNAHRIEIELGLREPRRMVWVGVDRLTPAEAQQMATLEAFRDIDALAKSLEPKGRPGKLGPAHVFLGLLIQW